MKKKTFYLLVNFRAFYWCCSISYILCKRTPENWNVAMAVGKAHCSKNRLSPKSSRVGHSGEHGEAYV